MINTGTYYSPDNTKRIHIEHDEDPLNPRENDNLANLWCEHPRLTLGDDEAKTYLADAISELAEKLGIDLSEPYPPCPECSTITREDWVYDDTDLDLETWRQHKIESCEICDGDGEIDNPNYTELDDPESIRKGLDTVDPDEEHIFLLPLYLYEHSGITMSTTPFGCRWDSGQAGMAFVTKEELIESGAYHITKDSPLEDMREAAHKVIRNEVEEYDHYITGNYIGYTLEHLDTSRLTEYDTAEDFQDDPDAWEEVDSCVGFPNSDDKHILEDLPHWVQEALG